MRFYVCVFKFATTVLYDQRHPAYVVLCTIIYFLRVIVGPDPVRMIMAVDAMATQSLVVGLVAPIQFERVLDVQNQIKVTGCHQSTTHAGEVGREENIHTLL